MKILLLVFLTVSCWLVPIRGFSSIIPPTVPQSTADTETITLDNDNHAPKQKQQKQHDYQDQDRLPGIPAPLCKLKRTVYLNGSLHHVAELMYNQPKNQMKIVTTVLGKEMILSWFRDGDYAYYVTPHRTQPDQVDCFRTFSGDTFPAPLPVQYISTQFLMLEEGENGKEREKEGAQETTKSATTKESSANRVKLTDRYQLIKTGAPAYPTHLWVDAHTNAMIQYVAINDEQEWKGVFSEYSVFVDEHEFMVPTHLQCRSIGSHLLPEWMHPMSDLMPWGMTWS